MKTTATKTTATATPPPEHKPGPITDNPIYIQLTRAEQMLAQVYEGRFAALIIYGPPGIGKSTLGEKVAKLHRERWRPERPGSALGLLRVLEQNRHRKVIAFDDIDGLWDDGDALDKMKVAFDTKNARYLSHTVGGSEKNSVKRFKLDCGAVFLTNRNLYSPAHFSKEHYEIGVQAVKDRSMLVGLSFDALACYEYTGWLATEGRMLAGIGLELSPGAVIIRNGQRITVNKSNRYWQLSAAETNDVLEHFAKHARRYPSIGPRDLYKFARMRIGADKQQWEGWIEEQLSGEAKWNLPENLHQYRIEPKAKALPAPVTTKPPPVKAKTVTKPAKGKSKPARV